MKIRDACTTLLSVLLDRHIADSTHVLSHTQWIVVEIITNQGLIGNSFMLTFDYDPDLLQGIVETELKKLWSADTPAISREYGKLVTRIANTLVKPALLPGASRRLRSLFGTYWERNPGYSAGSWALAANRSRSTAAEDGSHTASMNCWRKLTHICEGASPG